MKSFNRSLVARGVLSFAVLLACWQVAETAAAQEQFYKVRVVDLQFDTESGELPEDIHVRMREVQQEFGSEGCGAFRAEIEDGEGFLTLYVPVTNGEGSRIDDHLYVVMRVQGQLGEVEGTVYFPEPYHFTVPRNVRYSHNVRGEFYRTKEQHYARLARAGLAGGAWFRHQAHEARVELSGPNVSWPDTRPRAGWTRDRQLDATYSLFSGGRAISENIQFDRLLEVGEQTALTEPLAGIEGITIEEIDWAPLLADAEPQLDPLARYLPHDQHALFLPSFAAMNQLIEETTTYGLPVLRSVEPTSENARTLERYQQQLCLTLDFLSHELGGQVVESIAITGGDPYYRTGTDLAVLLEAEPAQAESLIAFLSARYAAAVESQGAEAVQGELAGHEYLGVVTVDRAICSFCCELEGAVVVTNSLAQLEQILQTATGELPSLASLEEYQFFRHRYARNDSTETAFLMVSDATIRRWCSPRWRIAASRRTRVLAILSELQAGHVEQIATGHDERSIVQLNYNMADLGEVTLDASGASSSVYGTLAFQTPIRELDLEFVTPEELAAYTRFRDRYQNRWSRFFDPIGVQLSLSENELAVDLTVMPLTLGSSYGWIEDLTQGGAIEPQAGDRHEEALLNFVFAIDNESEVLRQPNDLTSALAPDGGNPLGWMGNSIQIYIDEDPLWGKLAQNDNWISVLYMLGMHLDQAPIAIRAEVDNSLKAAFFLAALRAESEESTMHRFAWDTKMYRERTYVTLTGSNPINSAELILYYTCTPEAFVITPSEALIQRSIDREIDGAAGDGGDNLAEVAAPAWLGEHMALEMNGSFLLMLQEARQRQYLRLMRKSCFANLAILNEWHHRYPDHDPVELHEQLFHTRLECPGGGEYVWNEELQTMESTVYGSPADPREGPLLTPLLSRVAGAEFGLTFENDGLRARMRVDRTAE